MLIVGLLRPLLWWALPCTYDQHVLTKRQKRAIWTHLSVVLCQNTNTPPVRAQLQLPASSKEKGSANCEPECGALTRPLALASLSKHCRLSTLCNIFLKQNLGNKIISSSWLWSGGKKAARTRTQLAFSCLANALIRKPDDLHSQGSVLNHYYKIQYKAWPCLSVFH